MPPKKQMSEKQIALLQAWIDEGARWDSRTLKAFGEAAPSSNWLPGSTLT